MADFSQWQKSLRRSTGEILPKAVMPRTRRLKSIHEEVFDENDHVAIIKNAVKNGVQPRRRLSTRGSLSEVPINDKPRQSSVTRSPAKKDKTKSFLTKLPPCNLTIDKNAKIPKEPIPSPIPLPAGVTNIDHDDDSTLMYGRDCFNYVRFRDVKWRLQPEEIIWGESRLDECREKLTDWVIEIAHHFNCSQETLHHAINLMDRCMARQKFKVDVFQLLGVGCFLVATKLDEYYPADIDKLARLTDNSYTAKEIVNMERVILETLNFEMYGSEPMIFINRYIRAAQKQDDIFFYEMCIFFLDCLITSVKGWSKATDFKAASAVLAALVISEKGSKTIDELWSPTMRHYVWPNPEELRSMVTQMIRVLRNIKVGKIEDKCGLKTKYFSVSRHRNLLGKNIMGVVYVEKALATISS